jgi:DNA-binding XRE family transcriptional regulator
VCIFKFSLEIDMSNALPSSFGDLLQTLRKQKKIRQQPLADKLGVHRNTIGAWERGDRLPDTKGIVLELTKQLSLNEDEKRQLLEASLTALSSYWYVPYPRNPFFTGRHAFLQTLHHRLGSEQSVALSQSYALSGLGGIGKTQLALEYVYQHALDYSAIFWVAAETIETLYSSFATIASKLQLPQRDEQEAEKVVQAVLQWLDTHKEWLLVFDNVEDISLVKPFWPSARQGAVLITTRLRTVEDLSSTFELPPFPDDEGVEFLLHRAKLVDPTASSDPLPPELTKPARDLVQELGGLPLAIDQAGAYIERTGCSLRDYLHPFQHHQISLLAERSAMAHHPTSVVKTFLLSFERIVQANEAAADLLRLCAFLAPDSIPEELFTKGASSLAACRTEIDII